MADKWIPELEKKKKTRKQIGKAILQIEESLTQPESTAGYSGNSR